MPQEHHNSRILNDSSLNKFRIGFNNDDINEKLDRLEQSGRVPSKDK